VPVRLGELEDVAVPDEEPVVDVEGVLVGVTVFDAVRVCRNPRVVNNDIKPQLGQARTWEDVAVTVKEELVDDVTEAVRLPVCNSNRKISM
jgi:hypothetical protein